MGVAERRQREKVERKSGILNAAEKVMLEKGLAAATMDEIAQRAEVGKGTLYLYFKSKDELFLTIAIRSLRQLVERISLMAATEGTGFERLRNIVSAHAEFAAEHQDRFRVATSWVWSGYSVSDEGPLFEQYRGLIAAVFGQAVRAIEQGQADGSIRQDLVAADLAMQLWGAMLGVLAVQSSGAEVLRRVPAHVRVEALAASFTDLVLAAVCARRGGRSVS